MMKGQGKQIRSRWSKVALILVAPLLFLLVLEGLLALTGICPPLRLLQKVRHEGVDYWTTNPDYGRLWFNRYSAPLPSPLWIPVAKSSGVRRVLVLGESAAAGFPLQDVSLARVLGAQWALDFPEFPIEVANLTMTGINTHALLQMAREGMVLQPDLVILYAGHNEAIGPFGPLALGGRPPPPRWWIRCLITLRASRVGYALLRGQDAWSASRWGLALRPWSGLDEFARQRVPRDHHALARMYDHFRSNVRELIEVAGQNQVPVLLTIPAANLTDWPPLASAAPTLDDEAAGAAWKRGEVSALLSAGQVYRLAEREQQSSGWSNALSLYRLARDLDLLRFRADSRIQDQLRAISEEDVSARVLLVDPDHAWREGDPSFAGDAPNFFEHVHLTLFGLASLAAMLVDDVANLWGIDSQVGHDKPSLGVLADQLWYTEIEDYVALGRILDILKTEAMSSQPFINERINKLSSRLAVQREHLRKTWSVKRLEEEYDRAKRENPNDPYIHCIAGRLFLFMNDLHKSRKAFERFLAKRPHDLDGLLNLAHILINLKAYEDADKVTGVLREMAPRLAKLDRLQGELFMQKGDLALAEEHLSRAFRVHPEDHLILRNLSYINDLQGELELAIAQLKQFVGLHPDDLQALNNLAWLLATTDGRTETEISSAVAFARKCVAYHSDNHSFNGTLAVALAAHGESDQALEQARLAISMAGAAGDLTAKLTLTQALRKHGVFLR